MKTNEVSSGNIELKQYIWEVNDPKAAILIVHGYADHAKRYDQFAQFFTGHNYSVMAYDLRGHGESGGERAYVRNFRSYIDDLQIMLAEFEREYDEIPRFIFGHSMGGLIVSLAAARNKLSEIDYVILSNPALDIESNQPKIMVKMIQLLSKISPRIKTIKLDSQHMNTDTEEVLKYDNDPLIYRKGTKPGFANQFNNAGRWMRTNAQKFTHPLLLMYSMSDKVVVPKASEVFFEKIKSVDKEKVHFEGFYHELVLEKERDRVFKTMIQWCESKI